jgi:uncharacterized protein YegP (UPF0339 family)
MAASELMETKRACEDAVATVQAEAASAPLYDRSNEDAERGSV